MYTYRDIKNYVKVNGWIHFLLLPLRRIQSNFFVFERGAIYYFIPANTPEKKPDPSIITRSATLDDLDKLRMINPNTTLFREFLKNKDIFIIALIDEKVVGHLIFALNIPKRYKNIITLKSDESYVRDGFIHPEYRKMGIYSMIFSYASRIAESKGYSRVYGTIISNSQQSIKIHTKKFGFNPILSFKYVKFLFFEKIWINKI
jgi:GNAT superfamily N-acetyltransferase